MLGKHHSVGLGKCTTIGFLNVLSMNRWMDFPTLGNWAVHRDVLIQWAKDTGGCEDLTDKQVKSLAGVSCSSFLSLLSLGGPKSDDKYSSTAATMASTLASSCFSMIFSALAFRFQASCNSAVIVGPPSLLSLRWSFNLRMSRPHVAVSSACSDSKTSLFFPATLAESVA